MSVWELMASIGVPATLALFLIGVGRAVLDVARIETNSDSTRLSFSLCLGMGLVSTVLLVVCSILGTHPIVLGLTLAAMAMLAANSLRHAPGMVRRAFKELVACHPSGPTRMCASAALVGLLILLVTFALPPAVDWDSLAYHLEIPAEWLAAGSIHLPSDNNHVAFVGMQHMLYLPLLAVGAGSGPAVLSAFLALGAGLATFAAARSLFPARASALAFWLLWTSPIVLLVGITPRVDVTLALFLVTAQLGLLLAWRERAWKYACLAAVMLGMAFGIKYLGWLYALALGPLVVASAAQGNRGEFKPVLHKFGVFGALLLVASVPWLVKNWLLLDAPVFPFLASLRAQPWVQALYSDAGIVPRVSASLMEFHRDIRVPFNLFDLFVQPDRLAPDADARFSAPSLALLALPMAMLLPARKRIVAVACAPLLYCVALLVYSPETSLRYLLPALPALTIAAAGTLDGALTKLRRTGHILVASIVILMGLPALDAAGSRFVESKPWNVITGVESTEDYLARYWETAEYMRQVRWLDAHLVATDTVMLLFESRAYHTDVPVRQDMVHRTWALVQPFAHPPGCLGQAGISHVLVSDGMLRYFRARGARLAGISGPTFERYAEDCLELIHQERGFRIFRLRTASQSVSHRSALN